MILLLLLLVLSSSVLLPSVGGGGDDKGRRRIRVRHDNGGDNKAPNGCGIATDGYEKISADATAKLVARIAPYAYTRRSVRDARRPPGVASADSHRPHGPLPPPPPVQIGVKRPPPCTLS